MRNVRLLPGFLAAVWLIGTCSLAAAQKLSIEDLVSGVVKVKTFINPDGTTLKTLGKEREGSGVVIDSNGLILTIGYLMVEAYAAEIVTNEGRAVPANVVGYDHETGFGLLQATLPIKARPLAFGKSADLQLRDPVVVASAGGADKAVAALVVSKREFAGTWEYLLDSAIFTSPPHPAWSGAALINRDGRLVGIGSLVVGDANGKGDGMPGNMFVPIDRLPPILGDLIADGKAGGPPKPWLGVTTSETRRGLTIERVTAGGPAEKAGLKNGDVIATVNGEAPRDLADFYRKVWAVGPAGARIPLEIERESGPRRIEVPSMNRLDHLKLKSTF